MAALGVKQKKSPGVFPNRQTKVEKKVEKEFEKLTVKDQATLLMSRRNMLGWLGVITAGAGGLGRRYGPGLWARAGQLVTRLRLERRLGEATKRFARLIKSSRNHDKVHAKLYEKYAKHIYRPARHIMRQLQKHKEKSHRYTRELLRLDDLIEGLRSSIKEIGK